MSGIYIHIPFCKSRCIYCGFYSTTMPELQDSYTDALCKELEMRKAYLKQSVKTIYIGGGTPSLLSKRNLERIFNTIYKNYKVEEETLETEITLECNPDDVTTELVNIIKSLPVNRISMGVQTFDDIRLKFLGRRHRSSQPAVAVELLRNAGMNNVSLDLMYGFPGETLEEWTVDIKEVLKLSPEHISAYSLMYEEGTKLYTLLEKNEIKEIDEGVSVAMYEKLVHLLHDYGYEHYEISNFAKPGYRSKHNSSYWHSIEYLGVGAAAHSFNGTTRQWNPNDIIAYINGVANNSLHPEIEILTNDMMYDDIIMTRLRTKEGIELQEISNRFGIDYLNYLLHEAKRNIRAGLLIQESGKLRLSDKGVFVSDAVMSDLMRV